jgi:hypothetical protein
MRSVLVLVAILCAGAGAARADCPSPEFSPRAGSVLFAGDRLTLERGSVYPWQVRDYRMRLALLADDDLVPLRILPRVNYRRVFQPERPLRVGETYHLVWTGGHAGLGRRVSSRLYWVGGGVEQPSPGCDLGLPLKLALFGALPFAFGYVAARRIIIIRRRRIIASL